MKAIIDFACELRNGTVLATRKQPFICGDALAHMLRIDVTEGGQPADLAGTAATAYCVLSNRATATAGVTISGSTLLATFPASFYAVAGDTYVLIRLVRGDTKVDVLCLRYTVLAGATSTVYDPAGELPSLADFATAIAAANAAANAAMDAAGVANVKATLAESKASAAQQAATQAAQQAAIADGAALAAANAASSATAASAALNGLTASAAVLAAGSAATATVTEVDGHKHIAFGVPAGPKGDTGATGPQGPQGVPGIGNVSTVDGVLSDNDGDVALGALRYNAEQALTEPQKAQARTNIGLPPSAGELMTANEHTKLAGIETGANLAPNRNLLDNWDFRNPVNQRGVSAFTLYQYGLDRWILSKGTCTVGNGYIALNGGIVQRIEKPAGAWALDGKACTISVLLADGTVKAETLIPSTSGGVMKTADGITYKMSNGNNGMYKELGLETSASMQIKAIKLEVGTVSTLAQDAPMDYGVELAKCQRYFFKTGSELKYRIAQKSGANAWFNIPTPVEMRTVEMRTIPVIQGGYAAAYNLSAANQQQIPIGDLTVNANTRNGITLQAPFIYEDGFVLLDGVSFSSEL